jgi:hypothetical protein
MSMRVICIFPYIRYDMHQLSQRFFEFMHRESCRKVTTG